MRGHAAVRRYPDLLIYNPLSSSQYIQTCPSIKQNRTARSFVYLFPSFRYSSSSMSYLRENVFFIFSSPLHPKPHSPHPRRITSCDLGNPNTQLRAFPKPSSDQSRRGDRSEALTVAGKIHPEGTLVGESCWSLFAEPSQLLI